MLDLTRFLAGPFSGMVLADLGASVLKVEQLTGDSTRRNPPYFFEGDSAYFLSTNRNKQSIALDIRRPEGAEVCASWWPSPTWCWTTCASRSEPSSA